MKLISVIIPVFNVASFLPQCLDSVIGQTLKNIEIICIDDGSTDDSSRILAEYAALDERIQIITQPNQGAGTARNTGMMRACGEYLIFLDSDDWFKADFLSQMLARARETNADITICKSCSFDTFTNCTLPSDWMLQTGKLPGPVFSPIEISDQLFQFTYGWPWDKLYRTEFINKAQIYYPSLKNSEDLVFVFESLAVAKKICILDDICVYHRVNRSVSVSNTRDTQPEALGLALQILREKLNNRGLLLQYEKTLIYSEVELLIWHVSTLKDPKLQRQYFYKLRHEWIPYWESKADFSMLTWNRKTRLKYKLVRYFPFSVFHAVVVMYHTIHKMQR